MGNRLKDQVAIITGGGSGIGKAIAKAYVQEGAITVLAARNRENMDKTVKELKAMGGMALAVPTDVGIEEQLINMAAETMKAFGRIDILVNNAGAGGPVSNVVDMNVGAWNEALAADLTGAMVASREALKYMIPAKRGGSIIMMGAEGGRHGWGIGGYPQRAAYATAKMGLIALTETIAQEVGAYNIRVNCISPAGVLGARMMWVMGNLAKSSGKTVDETLAEQGKRYSLGRMATEEEVASVAVFLASNESSSITGQTIPTHCGYHW